MKNEKYKLDKFSIIFCLSTVLLLVLYTDDKLTYPVFTISLKSINDDSSINISYPVDGYSFLISVDSFKLLLYVESRLV